jgi:riboflavin biosynthesis pyrimidine reductase
MDSALATSLNEAPIWLYTGEAAADRRRRVEAQGLSVRQVPEEAGQLHLGALLDDLGSRGIRTLFVEGGATVLTAFLARDLADRVIVVTAPFLLGRGIEAVGDLHQRILHQARRPLSWKRWDLGDDQATELIFRSGA